MGIISAAGRGLPAFRDALFNGQPCFSKQMYSPLSYPIVGAFIQNNSSQDLLEKILVLSHNSTEQRQHHVQKIFRKMPWPIQAAMIATDEAWNQAAFEKTQFDRHRVGVIVSTQNSSLQYQLYPSFMEQPDYLSPFYSLQMMDSNYVGMLSDMFGIFGDGFTVGGASAGGNIALLRAYQLIQAGWQDACIVVGALADLSPMDLQGFRNIGALGGHRFADEPHKACRPFDKASEGFIYGQASACMILESCQSAKARNAPILGYLGGGAVVLDGNCLSDPSMEGEIRAMREGMRLADITVEQIDYINTHGSSSPLGDQIEAASIETVLGSRINSTVLNSTKSIIGHCLWSAGIVEAIATIIQMQEKFIHPSLNLENSISPHCQFITTRQQLETHVALSNSFGFGGINSSLVFKGI